MQGKTGMALDFSALTKGGLISFSRFDLAMKNETGLSSGVENDANRIGWISFLL